MKKRLTKKTVFGLIDTYSERARSNSGELKKNRKEKKKK